MDEYIYDEFKTYSLESQYMFLAQMFAFDLTIRRIKYPFECLTVSFPDTLEFANYGVKHESSHNISITKSTRSTRSKFP